MESELVKIAAQQGIWACLSVVLIFYIMKAQQQRDTEQEQREKNYQDIISKLTDKFSLLEDIKNDIAVIDQNLKSKNN